MLYLESKAFFKSIKITPLTRSLSILTHQLSFVSNKAVRALCSERKPDWGLHSLRSGGIASVVRNNSNSIPERLLKIHGRWKSDSAKDMYVEESLENKLQVTKYLGL